MQDYTEIFNARGHSYNEATSRCPGAREAERAALLDRLELKPGQRVGDAPAGGGYLADGIRARFGEGVEVVCIEPSTKFGAAIQRVHRVIHEPLATVISLPKGELDALGSLAGLHHFDDKTPVYREWHRLIRPGGKLAVADVAEGTGTGRFLNGFVDAFTPGGHDGIFFEEGEFTDSLEAAGFEDASESRVLVPWRFPDEATMASFCRSLFSVLRATPEQVLEALSDMVGIEPSETGGVQLLWELQYASAIRGPR